MAEYDEFRIELNPDPQAAGNWALRINDCPVKALVGPKGTVTPTFTHDQLLRLRRRDGFPNIGELRDIGASVWDSLMNPKVAAAYDASLAAAQQNGRRLRVLISIVGEEKSLPAPNSIRLAELPVEALWRADLQFIATSVDTPVSRCLRTNPDRDPYKVALPLRVLVVVATPMDMPKADMPAERQAILDALKPLGDSVCVDFCDPPTTAELNKRLQKPFHIIHFIAHGGFDIQGDDPTPRPYICMEDPGTKESVALDADTLEVMLRNSQVRLAVLTACSSAAPTPNQEPYPVSANDGIAQRLLRGPSALSAVVAMQFDLESEAAAAFSRCFYSNILNPQLTLDEVVSLCRKEIIALQNFGAGHRAWVTPTVYWRCLGGKVFDVLPLTGQLSEQARAEELKLSTRIEAYTRSLRDMAAQPDNVRAALAPLRLQYQQELEGLVQQRGALLGSTVRLWGGTAKAGGTIDCKITVCLRAPAVVDMVRFTVKYPPEALQLQASSAAPERPNVFPATAAPGVGQLRVVIPAPSEGQNWPAEEFAVGALTFKVDANQKPGVLSITVADVNVATAGSGPVFQPMDAVVFVSEP